MMSSILYALLGGVILGLSAFWLLLSKGRIAGISGILGGLLESWNENSTWRLSFLFGLLAGGFLLNTFAPQVLSGPDGRSMISVVIAGVLVGFGTRLGNGCTSGHGVCGITRFSPRSIVATLVFMATGVATVTLMGAL